MKRVIDRAPSTQARTAAKDGMAVDPVIQKSTTGLVASADGFYRSAVTPNASFVAGREIPPASHPAEALGRWHELANANSSCARDLAAYCNPLVRA
jgi:hypothetical protein